ncbi:molecular chaperone GrpE [Thermosulfidibacter takaii ABI70S6]|uniref:Protein GrpE n=1 Tax=Thermosulfidibacter takaii (strain DSM 17441 / JCM 13301 / NBRC 103674 / ABI70S6) TaxID=1298851 RepID=A0A0S3QUA5_THET7|nr:nucleotide exchange factor GrpE [Thermosulfidibacter takaii]BAT71914.1 molecular chaperone GrpE [Thermosulfidibacter takaii ABI70S6]
MEEEKNQKQNAEEITAEENKEEQKEADIKEESEKLKEELEKLKKERDALYDKLLRTLAEFDNFRKRIQRDLEVAKELANETIIKEILLVLDNFERALEAIEQNKNVESFIEGVKLIHKQLKETLKKFGVEEIEAVGKEFDPNVHEAIMQVEDEEKDNVVVQEVQKGYKLKGKLIRPSKVIVTKKKAS